MVDGMPCGLTSPMPAPPSTTAPLQFRSCNVGPCRRCNPASSLSRTLARRLRYKLGMSAEPTTDQLAAAMARADGLNAGREAFEVEVFYGRQECDLAEYLSDGSDPAVWGPAYQAGWAEGYRRAALRG